MSGYGMGNGYQPFTEEQIRTMARQQEAMNAYFNAQNNAMGARPGQRQTVERISPADRATMRAEAVTAAQIGPGQYEIAAWI